ncbi:uncharacterized protein LOC114761006 [Neltuma alba]|uniref:uncharacterized protein LOC114761006 n=1 Tax=Neltuma alba TaxID=207710 RepID=UPI0010A44D97|nr:uncharacterized protein LOC114761006 [Prosopis alba]
MSTSSVNSSSDGADSPAAAKTYSLFYSSSQTTSIKLDRSNFLVWESVVLPLIEGNRLQSHIDSSSRAPPRFVPGTDGPTSNPEYEEWFAVDRLLVGWLRNTMTQDVGAQLLHCKTALTLWNEARTLTCAATKARVMVFKSELQQTRKNRMKMAEYLAKMKSISDQLALAGAPISNDDLILQTLNGLDADYNPSVVNLIDKDRLTWVEAQASLLAFES